MQEKQSFICSCEDGIKKSVPHDYHFVITGQKVMMPIGDPRDRFLYLTFMIKSYNLAPFITKHVYIGMTERFCNE